jgi:hypothetical protein
MSIFGDASLKFGEEPINLLMKNKNPFSFYQNIYLKTT